MPRPEIITLQGRNQSLVWEVVDGGAPLWRYWGPRLGDRAEVPAHGKRTSPSFSLDEDVPLSIFPTFGVGWYGQTALLAHRAGTDFAQSVTRCAWERDGQTIRFILTDDVAHIEARLSFALDPASDVLTLSTSLTNTGDAPLEVHWLAAATLPLPADAASVLSYSGRHSAEFQEQVEPLGSSLWRRENRYGITSHADFPGALVLMPGSTDHGGTVYGAQLAWSGNSAQTIDTPDEGLRLWQLGAWLAPGEIILAPGETLETPQLLATCSTTGRDGIARNFHASIRTRATWPGGKMRPRPVILNTWEGFYFNHD
ncbi:MAG: alpha-galactosidase, partial [Alphaproteobacteria bacterium]|nr:alpha-galactosidase [Alphaproteobacteria bacterium]